MIIIVIISILILLIMYFSPSPIEEDPSAMSSYLVEQILSFAEFSLEKLRGLRRGGRGLEGCCCVYQSNCWSDQAADVGQFQPDWILSHPA